MSILQPGMESVSVVPTENSDQIKFLARLKQIIGSIYAKIGSLNIAVISDNQAVREIETTYDKITTAALGAITNRNIQDLENASGQAIDLLFKVLKYYTDLKLTRSQTVNYTDQIAELLSNYEAAINEINAKTES